MSWRPLPTEGHGSCNMQNKAIQGMLRNKFKPKNNYIFLYEKMKFSVYFFLKKTNTNKYNLCTKRAYTIGPQHVCS